MFFLSRQKMTPPMKYKLSLIVLMKFCYPLRKFCQTLFCIGQKAGELFLVGFRWHAE
ncbi:hypothetical protein PAHA111176_14575 [Parendozoicomonas haliclonae]|uniref:Uncharacterized protein n=1 Tax=Parendozoicomonas haliclonae TaxID=1960125 RepID=A0A1X7AHE8_9GAMM|nr:hypothetical protein EHSB41UT_01468 [Parendozoicomonas haliclonae]